MDEAVLGRNQRSRTNLNINPSKRDETHHKHKLKHSLKQHAKTKTNRKKATHKRDDDNIGAFAINNYTESGHTVCNYVFFFCSDVLY